MSVECLVLTVECSPIIKKHYAEFQAIEANQEAHTRRK